VLSEGTVSYLSRARSVRSPARRRKAEVWKGYQSDSTMRSPRVAPRRGRTGCNQIDIIKDKLFTNLPYMEGRSSTGRRTQVAADKLDGCSRSSTSHIAASPAGMQDISTRSKADTGFDAAPSRGRTTAQEVFPDIIDFMGDSIEGTAARRLPYRETARRSAMGEVYLAMHEALARPGRTQSSSRRSPPIAR